VSRLVRPVSVMPCPLKINILATTTDVDKEVTIVDDATNNLKLVLLKELPTLAAHPKFIWQTHY
jgi:hypothetical protein